MDFLNVKSLFIGGQEVKSLSINNQLVWQKKPRGWNGLKFENVGDGTATLSMAKDGSAPDVSLMYSTDDGQTWNDFVVCSSAESLDGTIITLPSGLGVCFKAGEGGNQTFATSAAAYTSFMMTGSSIKASGNINSLLDGENFEQIIDLAGRDNCFVKFFFNCTSLVDVSELQLPATTLVQNCYQQMFFGCRSLTRAPELPATTLASNCYTYMFQNCTSLNSIKLGYSGNFSSTNFNYWVSGVSSTGTFYYNGSDTTVGTNAIPSGWTVEKF